MSDQATDYPTRRMFVFGTIGGTIPVLFVPQWNSVKYHYDYTVMNHLNHTYMKLRRNGLMMMGGAAAGSILGYVTRNEKFD